MDALTEKAKLEGKQFGGQKGSGTEHMLVELVTEQLEALDDNRAATATVSIEFTKTFNCMDHVNCMEMLARRGASNQTLTMTSSFLTNRKIRVKLPGVYSTLRPMPGGTPQGTKSGNFLFCVSIADIAKWDRDNLGLSDLATRIHSKECSPDRQSLITECASSPIGGSFLDLRLNTKSTMFDSTEDGSADEETWAELAGPTPRWSDRPASEFRFIDDVNVVEKCDIMKASSSYSTKKRTKVGPRKKSRRIPSNC